MVTIKDEVLEEGENAVELNITYECGGTFIVVITYEVERSTPGMV